MVEVFMRKMFNDLCIFTLFVISIINPLLDDGDFVCNRLTSENVPCPRDKGVFL